MHVIEFDIKSKKWYNIDVTIFSYGRALALPTLHLGGKQNESVSRGRG